jgi:hypothetical protein
VTRAALAACLWLALAAPAPALVIRNDPGGILGLYADRVAALARSGEHVAVTGRCASACTLILALPAAQLCATSGARFGFHAAYQCQDGGTSCPVAQRRGNFTGTAKLWSAYPPAVRAWLNAHGGLTRNLKFMSGAAAGLRRCR